MFKPRNKTKGLSHSITKNCETVLDQTFRKAEETLEIKLSKSRENFSFNQPFRIPWSWMIGLLKIEVYNSISNITKKTIMSTFILKTYKIQKKSQLKTQKN